MFSLMCILFLFKWNEFIKILHSKHTDFDINDDENRKTMLWETVWLIRQNHTCIIIFYNFRNHWILIEVNISACVIWYYNSLFSYDLSVFCKFVKMQVKCIEEQLDQDYSIWKSSVDDVSIFSYF